MALLPSIGILGTAGCTTVELFSDDDVQTKVGVISLYNRHSDTVSVDLRIEKDGETVYTETYELEAKDPDSAALPGVTAERSWPQDSGLYTISARIADREWQTHTPTEASEDDCYIVDILTDYGGDSISIYGRYEDERCPNT